MSHSTSALERDGMQISAALCRSSLLGSLQSMPDSHVGSWLPSYEVRQDRVGERWEPRLSCYVCPLDPWQDQTLCFVASRGVNVRRWSNLGAVLSPVPAQRLFPSREKLNALVQARCRPHVPVALTV